MSKDIKPVAMRYRFGLTDITVRLIDYERIDHLLKQCRINEIGGTPEYGQVDWFYSADALARLRSERDAANRALFQAQEAAKKLLSERDAARDAALEEAAKFCDDVYELSATRDDGENRFEDGIKWATQTIADWVRSQKSAGACQGSDPTPAPEPVTGTVENRDE